MKGAYFGISRPGTILSHEVRLLAACMSRTLDSSSLFSFTIRTSPIATLSLSSAQSPSPFFLLPLRLGLCSIHRFARDRMLYSALNFAIGFFGYPFEGQYQQSITIEAPGVRVQNFLISPFPDPHTQFNNTLAPYMTCPNANDRTKSDRGVWYISRWASRYLKEARKRLASQIKGYSLTYEDIYSMQQTCAYEVCAIVLALHQELTGCMLGRPLPSDIPNSVSCSRRKSGKALTMRELPAIITRRSKS